jgi:hypothetical protein
MEASSMYQIYAGKSNTNVIRQKKNPLTESILNREGS